MMEKVFGKSDQIKAWSIVLLPFVDLDPNDYNCVYSTLKYIEATCKNNEITPVCTFDQSLWWKALQVLQSPKCDIGLFVIRLGGFHTLMSFLGCVGYLMANSGLTEALQVMYAENTVQHLLSGKAYNRSLRGHQIIDLALDTILLREVIESTEIDCHLLASMLDDASNGQLDISNLETSTLL